MLVPLHDVGEELDDIHDILIIESQDFPRTSSRDLIPSQAVH